MGKKRVKAGTDGTVLKSATKRRPPGGSRKGCPNKATANAREAIARFVDGNADRLQGWLDEIARDDGAKAAVACFVDLIEYHVPKLARTEVTGKDGKDLIPPTVNVNFPNVASQPRGKVPKKPSGHID